MNRIRLILGFVVSLLLVGTALADGVGVNTSLGVTRLGSGLAVRGYDVVAYFTDRKATKGSWTFAAEFNGATYFFKDAAHKTLFEREPARYAPQYGGFCAFGVAEGAKFDGDPEAWTVRDGKLYLNLDPEILGLWLRDVETYLDIAEHNWPRIRDKAPSELSAGSPAKLP